MKISIAIPAYNEEKIIKDNLLVVYDFCQANFDSDFEIVVADNVSTDRTGAIVKALTPVHPEIKYLYVPQKGKGNAVYSAWQNSSADVLCFMDADLATDLSALPKLIAEINLGNDVVLGCRYLIGSRVDREFSRKIVSQIYRLTVKIILGTKIKDLPCGFKAISTGVKNDLLGKIISRDWFFDSELAIMAEKSGYKIREIPITWRETRTLENKSRVNIFKVGLEYIKELLKLRKRINQL